MSRPRDHRPPKGVGRGDRLGLISRDPLLRDAAEIEAEVADVYARLAATTHKRALREGYRAVARLSRELSAMLAEVAAQGASLAHHPRPTRVRLNALCANQLSQARKVLKNLGHHAAECDPDDHTADMLGNWHRLEAECVLSPLLQILRIAPSALLNSASRLVVARREQLAGIGIAPPPLPAVAGSRPLRGTGRPDGATGLPKRFGTGEAWSATGCVERVNQARRCGTVRVGDGARAFFSFKALPHGADGLRVGDPVTVTLRRGPLGLTATWVSVGVTTQV